MRRFLPLLMIAAGLSGCSDPELELRVAQLESELEQMKKQGGPAPVANNTPKAPVKAPAQAGAADPARTEAAVALFREANQLVGAGKYAEAKTKLTQLTTDYADTPASKSGAKVLREIEVIGKAAMPMQVEKWYQGQVAVDPNKATLMVFWEVWCPHCKREVPKLEEMHKTWGSKGVQVIGLTKQTRNITDEQVSSFISEKGVSYPMAKEADGSLSRHYNVSGIPAAAVIKNNKVLWRGHPARITDDMLKEWTGS